MRPPALLARLRRVAVAGFACSGLALILPYALAWATHRTTGGAILEAFPTPLPDGRVRVAILFDFTPDAASGTVHALGWRQADGWCRADGDRVVDASDAARAEDRLRPTDKLSRTGTVFYHANDPAGSAFIIPNDSTLMRRHLIGSALVLVAIALNLPVRRPTRPQ